MQMPSLIDQGRWANRFPRNATQEEEFPVFVDDLVSKILGNAIFSREPFRKCQLNVRFIKLKGFDPIPEF
jgi:hypothetical protein